MRFPSISTGAAQWLVDYRNISCVGIDTTSIEYEPGMVSIRSCLFLAVQQTSLLIQTFEVTIQQFM